MTTPLAETRAPQKSHTRKGRAVRARIVRAAERLLATRGLHGTSMRDVAEGAGVPLATAVYHFSRKEQLVAAVLHDVARDLLATLEIDPSAERSPREALEHALASIIAYAVKQPARQNLLLRELLDNPDRVARARQTPLAPVLARLVELATPCLAPELAVAPELAALHAIGAVSYFAAARPTVRRIIGAERDREIGHVYQTQAIAFAMRALTGQREEGCEVQDGSDDADLTRAKGAHAPRGEDDRSRRGAAPRRRAKLRE